MANPRPVSPFRDRARLAAALGAPLIVIGFVLRIVLYGAFHDGRFDAIDLAFVLAVGTVFDALTATIVFAPAWGTLALFRARVLARPRVRAVLFACVYTVLCFNAIAEFFFFEEFNARYNRIAVDYVLYPTEVFTNLWESYNLPLVAACSLACGAGLAWIAMRYTRGLALERWAWSVRGRAVAGVLALTGVALGALLWIPAHVSQNRITSELAGNGLVELVRAFWNADLDYSAYYLTLPREEARTRAARVFGFPPPPPSALAAPDGGFELHRDHVLAVQHEGPPLDVVVVLEESFGSNFVGVLGHPELALTPHFDRWSQDGLLLTNLVANGNRTVRGLEGVLCSFVPLPGDSVVKRVRDGGFATLASAYAREGYRTSFFYGGYGIFDHMKPFMTQNGWEEFVEQSDYPSDAFTTAWGVADEYIFDALLDRQVRAANAKEHLFATLLSVSNHKPYSVPPGRTGRPDGEQSRKGAVAYADWAIGHYLDRARDVGILEHTVVLIVGDHGARVYGAEKIPVASYRIPALFLTPDRSFTGRKLERLCSQVDLGPTLLSLSGVRVNAPFLGADLTRQSDGPGRAFVHHNHDIGLLTDDALVVLGLQKTCVFYRRSDRTSDQLVRVEERDVTPTLRELERDAMAVFQTADELYRGARFRLPEAHVAGTH